jgi:hypothetical protein
VPDHAATGGLQPVQIDLAQSIGLVMVPIAYVDDDGGGDDDIFRAGPPWPSLRESHYSGAPPSSQTSACRARATPSRWSATHRSSRRR